MINGEYIDRTLTRYARRYGMYDALAVSVTQTAVTTGGNSVSQTVNINNGAQNKTRYGMYDAPAPESLITKAMRPLTRVERFKAWIKSWLS